MATVTQPITADPSQHRQQLTERLNTLRGNESFCDVTVAVKGKEFKAHKVVLAAASPFFLSLLESNMRENNEQLIRIELKEATASVMEDVLKYIYTGNVSITEESAHNLIVTADFLVLPGLKTLACDFLKEIVTTENCVFNYYFADKYHCVELKEKCQQVINLTFSIVMETDDFLNLDVKQLIEWVSSDDITVSAEEEVFKGIVKWVSHNKSEREKNFPELLHKVRLNTISRDFLLNDLVKEELITTNNECLNFVLGSFKWIFNPTNECVGKAARKSLQTHRDAIFVCGGIRAACYLPEQNMWYQLADTTFKQSYQPVVQYKDKVYILSVQHIEYCKTIVAEHYNCSNNSWTAIQTKFEKYENFMSLSVLNDDLYATGSLSGMVYLYHPDKNEWNVVKSEHVRYDRCGSFGVSDGRHLYVIGGTLNDEINRELYSEYVSYYGSTAVEKYDPSENSWKDVAPMNEERHEAFGASMNGKIYVAGGLYGRDQLLHNTCEVYNPSTNEWQLMPSLNVPRYSASMVCLEGALYVIGGHTDNQQSRLSVEMLDFKNNEWKKKTVLPVKSLRSDEEDEYYNYLNRACVATIHKDVLSELKPLI